MKKVLIFGSSMSNSWKSINPEFYKELGISEKIIAWHGEAWRYKENNSPYNLMENQLTFHKVKNKSKFFRNVEEYSCYGAIEPCEIESLSGIIFTQPTVERHFISSLYKKQYFVYGTKISSLLSGMNAEDTPNKLISNDVFYNWWISHQFHTNEFLKELTKRYSGIKVFVTPEITGRKDQNYTKEFNQYYLYMMENLCSILKNKFNVQYCLQPEGTYDPAEFFTKNEFAFAPPDPHHYSGQYVKAISETNEFKSFIDSLT